MDKIHTVHTNFDECQLANVAQVLEPLQFQTGSISKSLGKEQNQVPEIMDAHVFGMKNVLKTAPEFHLEMIFSQPELFEGNKIWIILGEVDK